MDKFVKAEDVKDLLNGLDSLPWEDEVEDIVDKLVVADVVEVKHGKWRLETDEEMPNPMFKLVECSVCKEKTGHTFNYCPNCGAKVIQ